jgi:hypothetical protein
LGREVSPLLDPPFSLLFTDGLPQASPHVIARSEVLQLKGGNPVNPRLHIQRFLLFRGHGLGGSILVGGPPGSLRLSASSFLSGGLSGAGFRGSFSLDIESISLAQKIYRMVVLDLLARNIFP